MDKLEKNIFLIFLVPALLVFAISYGFMAAAKDNPDFYLEDLEGNRDALKSITISGYLEDRYHGRYFEIKNGTVQSKFIYYQHRNDIAELNGYVNFSNGLRHNDFTFIYNYNFEISRGAKTEERPNENNHYNNNPSVRTSTVFTDSVDIYARITKTDDIYQNSTAILFDPGLRYKSNGMDIGFIKHEYFDSAGEKQGTTHHLNRETFPAFLPRMAMTVLNDELYFSIICTKEYSGRNGIYKAVNFEPWWQNSKYRGTVDIITSFDLDDTNMEVLGLEAVKDKLVLLLFEDNEFKARLYNTEGKVLDELAFNDITSEEGFPEYQGFVRDSYLNIYLKYANENRLNEKVILSIGIEGESLSHKHKVTEYSNQEMYPHMIASKDDMLYVIALTKNIEELSNYPSQVLTPGHLMIFAYKTDNDKTFLVYSGELVTDANQDYYRNLYINDMSFGYNSYDYREFHLIDVR